MTALDDVGARASDADRDAALAGLRDAYVKGRISHETLVIRVDAALAARTHPALEAILADLGSPRQYRRLRWPLTLVSMLSRWAHGAQAAWRAPTLPLLVLPDGANERTIGRSPQADLPLGHEPVSRLHATLRQGPDGWLLADLGSTNGTFVNGWRVRTRQLLRSGDVVRFGELSFVAKIRPR